MSVLKYKTRGGERPQGLRKVYFCAHDDDIDRYFEEISDEILKYQRCSIWYAPKGTPRNADFFADLQEMNLFVMPVTSELLFSDSKGAKEDFLFAQKNHKPFLPLLLEPDLVSEFNAQFRNIQYLDKYCTDTTALPYEEKLKNYLHTFLVSDELARKIRESFDAYLFLSYRKTDRRYAQKLMRLIHKNEFCRDVAIWYDEFLIPGEDFRDNIQKAMEKSNVFVLTVTPNVLEYVPDEDGKLQKNYVVRVEFKEAHDTDKNMILPVLMVPTNQSELDAMFDSLLPECTDGMDQNALANSLLSKLSQIPLRQNDRDSEHNFYIGLAYLSGVDVEIDIEKARLLLTTASDDGYSAATAKLVEMYYNGLGVAQNITLAISWQKKLISQREKAYRKDPTKERFNSWFWSVIACSDYCTEKECKESLDEAVKLLNEAKKACIQTAKSKLNFNTAHELGVVYERMGDVLRRQNNEPEAQRNYQNCLKIRQDFAAVQDSEENRKALGICYERLGDMAAKLTDYDQAISFYSDKLTMSEAQVTAGGTEKDLEELFLIRYKLAKSYLERALQIHRAKDGDLENAREYCGKAITLAESLSVGNDSHLAQYRISSSCSLMGKILINIGELKKAIGNEFQMHYDSAEEYAKKGLAVAKQMHEATKHSLQATQYLITAYRRYGEIYYGKTSHLTIMDYSDKHDLDQKTMETLRNDQSLLEKAKTYYSKGLDIAIGAYRIYGNLPTANDLYICHMDLASVCYSLLRLPLDKKTRKLLQDRPMKHYSEALKLAQNLSNQHPTPGNQESIAHIYWKMTVFDPSKKKEYLPKAIAIYEQLLKQYPNVAQYRNNLETFRMYLEGTEAVYMA